MTEILNKQIVLDCSVVMAWCFEDEQSKYADAVLELVENTEFYVPAIWSYEVENVLLTAEKNKRISRVETRAFFDGLSEFDIRVAVSNDVLLPRTVGEIAREKKLTIYDAAYLDLAYRNGLPLATLDKKLSSAAKSLSLLYS